MNYSSDRGNSYDPFDDLAKAQEAAILFASMSGLPRTNEAARKFLNTLESPDLDLNSDIEDIARAASAEIRVLDAMCIDETKERYLGI